jgi:DivIVA domain-containing protein
MFFRSRQRTASATESPGETLARLNAQGDGSPRFRTRRGGYSIPEVDAFLASIDTRTPREVLDVQFHVARRKEGYHEDDVDRYLDDVVANKTTGEGGTGSTDQAEP